MTQPLKNTAGDWYTWNLKDHSARGIIETYLDVVAKRVELAPGRIPFDSRNANLAIAWMRALLDRKPSEMDQ